MRVFLHIPTGRMLKLVGSDVRTKESRENFELSNAVMFSWTVATFAAGFTIA